MARINHPLSDTWEIALHHGHAAFRLLSIVNDIEKEFYFNFSELDNVEYGRSKYLDIVSKNHFLTRDHLRIASASVLLFQAMMEALINDSLEKYPKLNEIKFEKRDGKVINWKQASFEQKWVQSLNKIKKSSKSFNHYYDEIYKKYRIPLIHPKKSELKQINDISFDNLYKGYYYGWESYGLLYDGLDISKPNDDSWNNMCNTYKIPILEMGLL